MTFVEVIPRALESQCVLRCPPGPKIAGHDDDSVPEVDGPALAVRQASVIKHLQKRVEHLLVGFFNFIKQDHAERSSPDRFR